MKLFFFGNNYELLMISYQYHWNETQILRKYCFISTPTLKTTQKKKKSSKIFQVHQRSRILKTAPENSQNNTNRSNFKPKPNSNPPKKKEKKKTSAAVTKGWRILRSQFFRSIALSCLRAVPISASLWTRNPSSDSHTEHFLFPFSLWFSQRKRERERKKKD